MNGRVYKRGAPDSLRLMALTLLLLIAPGCGNGDPATTLPTFAADLARQLATWWLL